MKIFDFRSKFQKFAPGGLIKNIPAMVPLVYRRIHTYIYIYVYIYIYIYISSLGLNDLTLSMRNDNVSVTHRQNLGSNSV